MVTGTIFDLRRFSIHDGPGIRTTVFFKGCPLACAWCHNPESQSTRKERIYRLHRCEACGACAAACPEGALVFEGHRLVHDTQRCRVCGSCAAVCCAEAVEIAGRELTTAEVIAQVERDRPFYEQSGGGVTFSGGEPLLQPAFLLELLQACRALEIHTAVDTCGQAGWETLERILPFVDLFLYDLKLMDSRAHQAFTGAGNERIIDNLRRLAGGGQSIWLRVPVLPGINDDPLNIAALGELAASLPGVERIDLLPYHPAAAEKYSNLGKPYALQELAPPTQEQMENISRQLESCGLKVHVGG